MSPAADAAALQASQNELSSTVTTVACQGCGQVIPVASADDPRGNKMARAAGLAGGLTTPEEFEAFHDAITGQGITDFHELVEIAKQVKAGGV